MGYQRTRVNRDDKPDPIDVHIGVKIKQVRLLRGMTQLDLARESGVNSHQTIQKHEKGYNSLSCNRLIKIAEALAVSPATLLGDYAGKSNPEMAALQNRQVVRLIHDFNELDKSRQNILKSVMNMLKGMGPVKAAKGISARLVSR